MRRFGALLLSAVTVIGLATAGARGEAVQYRPGAPSLNDDFTPGLGNGGYDVQHYGIVLSYDPSSGVLTGVTTITAVTTQNLSQFDLDFALPVRSVTVNGHAAPTTTYRWPSSYDRELVVTPSAGLAKNTGMTVVVRYAADPSTALLLGGSEWNPTVTGYTAWDEPLAASEWWYPANAYPSDKATYDVTVTTPVGYNAISNGRLVAQTSAGGKTTVHWQGAQPMSSYLSVLALGHYDIVQSHVLNGIPAYYAVERGLGPIGERARHDLMQTPAVLSFLQAQWGPYPFSSAGGTVEGLNYPSALETQTRPTYEAGLWQENPNNVWAILHENAHEWFGDDVTTRTWSDTWLAEGFATYNEWLWSQAQHTGTAEQLFLATYREYGPNSGVWDHPLNEPGFSAIGISVYVRGAMLLQALRNRVGSPTFTAILRSWLDVHRYGNADSGDFVALAESMTAQDLTSFFQTWLYGTSYPAPTADNGFPGADRRQLATGAVPVPASLADIQRTDAALAR